MPLSSFIVETYPIHWASPKRRINSLDGSFPAISELQLMTGGLIRPNFGL
jgi:hypothetical protein